jgi:hypothetical protein
MRVMRANLDGSQIEVLVQTGEGDRDRLDQTRWCVGIAVDPDHGQFYWTQKGGDNAEVGRFLRAGVDVPQGQTATNRSDVEVLFDGLPEPIDLELDLEHRVLYWTDRGNPPRGSSVNRARIDAGPGQRTPEIVVPDLMVDRSRLSPLLSETGCLGARISTAQPADRGRGQIRHCSFSSWWRE